MKQIWKSISNWFAKKPQTKASYITAIANLGFLVITTISVLIAVRVSNLNREMADKLEAEKIVLQFHGGRIYDDFETEFATIPSLAGPKKTVVTSRWPIIISNNGQKTVSLIYYRATSRIYGEKRNIETTLLDTASAPISLPAVVRSGESIQLFLVVPIHIPSSVLKLLSDTKEFDSKFTLDELERYLQQKHGVDLYGNKYRYAEKSAGVSEDRVPVHIFSYNDDGTLTQTSMQADQVTVEFRTSRENYFTARALFYERPAFEAVRPILLPRGRPARVNFELESIDSLPRFKDSNTDSIE